MSKIAFRITIAALIMGAAICFYAVCIEPFRLVKTEWQVYTSKWPYDQPLKIALIADIHASWPWMTPTRLAGIVAKVNAEKPDLILLLGDYVATHSFKQRVSPGDVLAELDKLSAPCGVYAVLGNHDFDPRMPEWRDALSFWERGLLPSRPQSKTIRLLQDDMVTCNQGNEFYLVGLKDQWRDTPELDQAMGGTDPAFPAIIAMHEPDLFPEIDPSVALTVAGHTHGGQVVLPFYGPVFVPSKYGTRYAYGYIVENGKDMVVSSGLGMSIFPARFLRPPEVTYVTLSKN